MLLNIRSDKTWRFAVCRSEHAGRPTPSQNSCVCCHHPGRFTSRLPPRGDRQDACSHSTVQASAATQIGSDVLAAAWATGLRRPPTKHDCQALQRGAARFAVSNDSHRPSGDTHSVTASCSGVKGVVRKLARGPTILRDFRHLFRLGEVTIIGTVSAFLPSVWINFSAAS
jgi:hypothetical protein